jgi:amino acid adenylation domain-containing protein/non-ribosomal peptide synthase protein (TIGR01720 family)
MMSISDIYELSPMQQGMLFQALYAPESAAYFEQRHCVIKSHLNPQAFRQAWQSLVDRYAVLRTEFYWAESEKPLQVVRSQAELPWLALDWRDLPATDHATKLTDFLERDRQQGFNLQQAPLMRCTLIQLADTRYCFVWSHHHLLMDGWCNGILLQDVLTLYAAFCQGKSSALPPAPAYREYILWLQQQDLTSAELYWRECLAGFTSPLPMRRDRATPRHDSFHTATLILSTAFTTELQAFARQQRFTLNTLVQTAWAIWLSRWSGMIDVVFGTTVSGRPAQLPNVEKMVGLFINTLPLRVQLNPSQTRCATLHQVQTQQVNHSQYEFSSLHQIQSWSDVLAGRSLFDSIVVFENYPVSSQAIVQSAQSQLQISEVEGFAQTDYPLVLSVIPGAELSLQLDYVSSALEPCPDEIGGDRVLEQLHWILQQLIRQPEQSIATLSLLSPEQYQQVLALNLPSVCEFSQDFIHQRFEQQAEQSPDQIALVHGDQSLTYAELNQRANQLAQVLRSWGVQPETRVGICLERSSDLIMSLLAVLKAGGAYVPIDPNLPAQRFTYLVKDAQLSLLISRQSLFDPPSPLKSGTGDLAPSLKRRAGENLLFLDLDTIQTTIAAPTPNLPPLHHPRHLAYLIYTSGSTGLPKGVMIEHHALTNFVNAAIKHYELAHRDRVLQFASISFDVAVEEIFPCLAVGGTLILRTEEMLDPTVFWRTCRDWQLSVINLPTAFWHQLVDALTPHSCPDTLRLVIVGGEAAQPDRVRTWQQTVGSFPVLINAYGPTEATVTATLVRLTAPISNTVPIGQAIANVATYVLDDQLQPVAMGMIGELYLGGAGIARGYWQRPELTAERFIPVPESVAAMIRSSPAPLVQGNLGGFEDRLYKTGDRVRYRPDGNLEFVGRQDEQIKLRGYRIELNEIAAQLQQHPDLTQVIALLRDADTNPQIVAYFTTVPGTGAICEDDLRQFLSDRLPAYMVPAAWVAIDQFPLTATGKLDRHALPAPTPAALAHPPIALRSPTADVLTLIWQQVLQRQPIGIHDNFFALGGHSLLAIQLITQIQQTLQIELPLRSLFESPTIADLSGTIDTARLSKTNALPPIQPCDRAQPLPLSFAQQRLWVLAELEPASPAYTVPAALRLTGTLNIAHLQQSWMLLVQRHESLRTAIHTIDGQPIIQIASQVDDSIPVVDLTTVPFQNQETIVRSLIQQDLQQPLPLDRAPLWRVKLFCLSESEFILVLLLHHAITDAWSMEILGRELIANYELLQRSLTPNLLPLPIQYVDFAQWQRQWLPERWQQQLTYWQQHLHNAPPLLELPTDRPRPPVQTFRGQRSRFQLDTSLMRSLQTLSQQHNATLFMTVLAAFNVFLYRLTQQTEIVIGTPIANRHYPNVAPLIGFFANTLALRTCLANNPTFAQILAQIRQTVLDAYAHQDLPFEQWIEALGLERSLSYSPIFQVLLVVEPAPAQPLTLPDLSWQPLELDNGTAKVDLTLMLTETADGWQGQWEYNADLFDSETIARWSQHWQTLLQQLVCNSSESLAHLSLLTELERDRLLYDWHQPQHPYLQSSVIALFEQQVVQTPETIALICGDQTLTYRELNQQANQLAHHLHERGIDSETIVGLYLNRSITAIISLLAILKVGAVYLPIDPANPRDRVEKIVQDANLTWIIATLSETTWLTALGCVVITTDDSFMPWQHQPTINLQRPIHPDQLAYIMYTSGSTGMPKGVCIPHRGIVRLVKPCEFVEIGGGDRVLHAASLAFDAATFEIWGALLNGATVVIVPAALPSLEELAELMQTHAVNILWLTAGLFHLMVEEQIESFQGVRSLIAGGDVLSSRQVSRLLEHYPQCQVINGYGPTEGTTFTCCHAIAPTDLTLMAPPIGRPIPNTQVYVLDVDLQPVPIGVPGELYIGGAGLARGYLNRPELTAERFVPCPHPKYLSPGRGTSERSSPDRRAVGGEVLYKTGDRVCWRSDGTLLYLGRYDNQVKIRGFRVEPGEAETVLSQHPDLAQVAVLHHRPTPEQGYLVAYYTPVQVPAAGLRDFLQTRLPHYLIPAYFIGLDTLPLTVNGKLDRRLLPLPEERDRAAPLLAPTTDLEHTLMQIWQTVLRCGTLSLTDNFFELGGDSILAIQLVSRINQAGWHLTPKQLFQSPTIAELSQILTPRRSSESDSAPISGIVPLTPIQHWFLEQALPNPDHFNQAVWLEATSPWPRDRLDAALRHLLHRHDALRLRLCWNDSEWTQEVLPVSDRVPLTWVDYAAFDAEQQNNQMQRLANQTQRSLNLNSGELVRVVYCDLGDRPHRFLVVIHHWAIDAVSWRILLEELQTLDRAWHQGIEPELLPKTTSFQRWADRLQTMAMQTAWQTEQKYWQTIVQQPVQPLPVDHPNGDNRVKFADHLRLSLSPAETESLLRVVPMVFNAQMNEVLLSAIAQGFQAWTGAATLRFDLESHGRSPDFADDLNLSRTVGWLTALFPVCLTVPATADPSAVLLAVQDQLRAIPQQGMGYGLLRYLTETGSTLASHAEVSVNYLGQLDSPADPSVTPRLSPSPLGKGRLQGGLQRIPAAAVGDTCAPDNPRSHRLEIIAAVQAGQLDLAWHYSRQQYAPETIATLAHYCLQALQGLIAQCQPVATLLHSAADGYPLSPMQQGMLFHSLYAPHSGAYEVQICYELIGSLQRYAFEQAWQALIDRHPPLRTSFRWEHLPQPLQVVHSQVDWAVTYLDWSDITGTALVEGEPQGEFAARLQSLPRAEFVLTQAPLMQVTLIRLTPGHHYFIWRYHHLLLDGWSVPILLREFLAFYQAACQGQSCLIAPARPYRRYIQWLAQQSATAAEQYWRQALKGFTAPTPIALPRSPQEPMESAPAPAYAELELSLSPDATQQFQQWAKQQHLTLNTLIQAAWALLLQRYSGDREVVFGVVCAGRPATLMGADEMVGLFVNTVPLRVAVSPTQPLAAWLQDLQAQQVELQQYAYSSLIEIQRWSEVERSLPLFETLIVFENYPVETALKQLQSATGLAGLQIRHVRGTEQTNYPLTLYAIAEEQLSLKLLYDCDRFDAATIQSLLDYLHLLLEQMTAVQSLHELPCLNSTQQQQLIEWNRTASPCANRCIHQLIDQQAQQTPTAIALSQAATHLTYAELNHAANQLAHRLLEFQFAPETRIGIYLERSPQLVIALLAVMKIGAAYLPLDPGYPPERLAFMLKDAAAAIVLTQTHLATEIPGPILTLALDSVLEQDRLQSQPTHDPAIAIAPPQLAYLIYTSGSTGTPKGVQVTHLGLVNMLTDLRQRLEIQPTDTLLAITTIAFDIAALELFLPLISGARVWLGTRQLSLDADQLITTLAQQSITLMQATPTTWRMLVHQGWQGKPDLQILCGGEALDRPLAADLLPKGRALWNLYGPTETTIWSAVHRVDHATSPIAIGRPLANTQFWVLDETGHPVPIGVAGELHIGGAGVARGYWQRPDLTAERFIPYPKSFEKRSPLPPLLRGEMNLTVPLTKGGFGESFEDNSDHQILYKTGDRVRYLPDGSLEYLGRLDHQVKLRGYRIEVGEIESALQRHAEVEQAVVRLLPDAAHELRLVAYLCPVAPATADLRQFLATSLPSYMIPAIFVSVAQFPLTPNGKLDRNALPHPESSRDAAATVLPQTDLERSLAVIWQTILHLETVGIDDNFFDLGGHSLRMVQLQSAVRDRFDSAIALVDLFRYSTIRSLAAYLKQTMANQPPDSQFEAQVNARVTELTAGKQRLQQRRQQRLTPPSASGDHR